jgi:hypothetical protein
LEKAIRERAHLESDVRLLIASGLDSSTVKMRIVTIIDKISLGVTMLSVNKSSNSKGLVPTLSDFRRIALSMPETEELIGMGYPNFRTGRKSFATIEDKVAVIRLTRGQQETFVATAPEVFAADSSGWGRLGTTVIRLEAADEATVRIAVATAWSNVAEVGNASEVVAAIENANELVEVAEVVETGCGAKAKAEAAAAAAEIGLADATEVNSAVDKFVNAGEVAGKVSAAEVVPEAQVVKIENAAAVVEPRDHLLCAVSRPANSGNHGERSMTLALLAVTRRENMIDLKYGSGFGDPQPFTLTVTPEYVAHGTAKSPPISASHVHAYILAHAAKLKATAENCKARGLTAEVLQ